MHNMKRFITYFLIVFTLTACGPPQPAQAATNAQSIQFLLSQVRNASGSLAGGKVYAYATGTTTPKTIWLDRGKVTPAANPYTLDSNGTAQLFGDGLYHFVIKTSAGVTVYDRDGISIKDASGLAFDVADYASLAAAVTALGSTPATLQYSTDQTLAANLVIPATLELMPLNGAVINHGAYTISYAGSTARWPVTQIFNGTGAVTLSNSKDAFPEWWGAKADGTTDSATAINACIASVQATQHRPVVRFMPGIYVIGSTITVTADDVTLVGVSMGPTGQGSFAAPATGVSRGTVFKYRGTGTAMSVGLNVGAGDGTYLRNVKIEGISLDLADNTTCGLRVWMCYGGLFKDIAIYGNYGASRSGLWVSGSVAATFHRIFVNGQGQTQQASTANYLNWGIRAELGYNNLPGTTTVFRDCYINYCDIALRTSYVYTFENCVFEASNIGVQGANTMTAIFNNCWWEANNNTDIAFSAQDVVTINGGRINPYSRAYYFASNGGVSRLILRDVIFQNTYAAADISLFAPGANILAAATGRVDMSGCSFSTNGGHTMLVGGAGSPELNFYPAVIHSDMRLVTYRFIVKAITGAYNASALVESGYAGAAYKMPEPGIVVGINSYYSGSLGAGSYTVQTKINGTDLAYFSYPIFPSVTTNPVHAHTDIHRHPVLVDDSLSVFVSNTGFSGGDLVVEVQVLHGATGVGL
jgi:hypothetical protein